MTNCDKQFYDLIAESLGPNYCDANASVAMAEQGNCAAGTLLTLNGRQLPIEPTSLMAIAMTSKRFDRAVHGPEGLTRSPLEVIAFDREIEGREVFGLIAIGYGGQDYFYNPFAVEALFCKEPSSK